MRLAAASIATLIALLVLEGAVRVLAPQGDFFSRSDDTFGVRDAPNMVGWSRSPEYAVPVVINSQGFRDREHALEKPAGTKRILVLGDSFTEALQVSFEETFHARLEAALLAQGAPVEVLTMGLPGVGTAQELLVYENVGWRFAPDVVLVAWFSGNDL